MSVDTNTSAPADGFNGVEELPRDASAVASVHETAVAEIVGMVRAKYEDEGDRNFAIGKRAFEHAQWQRGNFAGYEGADFDNLMNRVRDDVRIFVAISPKSIKLGEWVRCHVLRAEVAKAKGFDAANKLSFFEYRSLYGKALSFDKANVEGSLVDGWLDFVMGIAAIRSTDNGRVTSEAFMKGVADHEVKLAEAKAPKLSDEQARALAQIEASKAKVKATGKATADLTSNVSDALSQGLLPIEAVLGIVENVAKHHNVALPAMGIDYANISIADCDEIAGAMFTAGKYAEMVHLRDTLAKMVSTVDKLRGVHTTAIVTTTEASASADKVGAFGAYEEGQAAKAAKAAQQKADSAPVRRRKAENVAA